MRGSFKGVYKGSFKGVYKGSFKGIYKGSFKGVYKSEMWLGVRAPSSDFVRAVVDFKGFQAFCRIYSYTVPPKV